MQMRITTNMMMNTYRFNLQGTTKRTNDSLNQVLTHRTFDRYYQDPAAATKAWRIRRAMVDNNSYQRNGADTGSRIDAAWLTLGEIKTDLVDNTALKATIRADNDPTASGRNPLGVTLRETAESVIQNMNGTKYGSHFVFSGDDEMNPPFSWNEDHTVLYYRGVNVNAGAVKSPAEAIPDWAKDGDGNLKDPTAADAPADMPETGADDIEQAWIDFYKSKGTGLDPRNAPGVANWGQVNEFGVPEATATVLKDDPANQPAYNKAWAAYYKDQGDLNKLKKLSAEEQFVDLGMGNKEDDDGNLINGTAFDRSLPGINMIGFGVDEEGYPKNLALLMKKMGAILERCDPDKGTWASDQDRDDAYAILDRLQAANNALIDNYTTVDTKRTFLNENQERLETQGKYLNEEMLNIEQVNLADAITNFSWDYYCYSAALKVGTQLLSQSLLDYMR